LIEVFITSLELLVSINIFYLAYIFWIKKDRKSEGNFEKGISVIISARDEAENLNKFIPKILNQQYKNFEIIVVNDRSSDNSSQILSEFESEFENFRFLEVHERKSDWNPKKWALKQGVELAKYDYLIFTDADCYPKDELWIQKMANGFLESDFVIGNGIYENEPTFLNNFIQFENYQTSIAMFGLAQKSNNYMALGRNFGIKKSHYQQFDWGNLINQTGGDDDLLANKIGIKSIAVVDGATVSIPKNSWSEYFSQKTRHVSVSTKYSMKNKAIIGLYNLSQLSFYLLIMSVLLSNVHLILAISLILFRTLILFLNFANAKKCIGLRLAFSRILVLDFCYNIFLWIVGFRSVTVGEIKWK
jgi:glycosyltransferase involved in cell wall biosynthesis